MRQSEGVQKCTIIEIFQKALARECPLRQYEKAFSGQETSDNRDVKQKHPSENSSRRGRGGAALNCFLLLEAITNGQRVCPIQVKSEI